MASPAGTASDAAPEPSEGGERAGAGAGRGDRTVAAGGWALALVVLAAAAVRFASLGVQGFSDDEQFTVWLVQMPFGDMVTTVPQSEATPHLFYLLEWFSARLFGSGEVGMRILPALLGTLTVPVVYRTGALAGSRRVGLAAAAVAAVDPFLIWYSQEARAYSLVIFLTALGLMWLVQFLRSGGRAALAGWALVSAAALATHYFAAFVVIPEAAWLVLSGGRADRRRRLAAVAVPVAAGLALLPLALHQRDAVGDPGGVGSRGIGDRLVAIPKNFLVGFSVPAELLLTIAAGVLAAVALALAWRRSEGAERRLAALAGAVAAAAVALSLVLAALGSDYVTSRNLVIALVPATLVLGVGFAAAGRAGSIALAALGAVMLTAVIGVAAEPRYQRRDWRGAADALGPPRVDRVLVFSPGFTKIGPFEVYFGGSRLVRTDFVRVRQIAVVALADYGGFGPGPGRPPGGPTPRAPAGFRLVRDVSTPTYRIVLFSAPRPVVINSVPLRRTAFPGTNYAIVAQGAL
jgi:mannosyltransferase